MLKVLSKVFLIVIFSIAVIGQDMDPDAARFYNEGNSLYKAGNYQGALNKYSVALKTSQNYRIYYQMGVTYKKLYKYDDAEAAFQECIKAQPEFASAYNGLGGTYFANNNFEKAIEAFSKFEQFSENKNHKNIAKKYIALAYTKLGAEAKSNINYDKAIAYFRKAVESSKYDKAYLSLAEVLIEAGKYDEALQAADNALNYLDKIPKAAALYYKGLAFKNKNLKDKAVECFQAGLRDKAYGKLCKYELDNL